MSLDLQLTLLSTVLLLAATGWPLLFSIRRRTRWSGARAARAGQPARARSAPFVVPAALIAASVVLLLLEGVL